MKCQLCTKTKYCWPCAAKRLKELSNGHNFVDSRRTVPAVSSIEPRKVVHNGSKNLKAGE